MNKTIKLITQIGIFVLVAVALLFTIWTSIDAVLIDAYITLGIAVTIALVVPIIRIIIRIIRQIIFERSFKLLVKILVGGTAIVVLWFVSSMFASNDFTELQLEKMEITKSTSILVGTVLNLTFIVGSIAVSAVGFLAARSNAPIMRFFGKLFRKI